MRDLSDFFKVLADEARLQMLWLLFQRNELCVCDLMSVLDIGQSKASRHLAALRAARLVNDRKVGAWTYYSLRRDTDPMRQAQLEQLRVWMATRPNIALLNERLEVLMKQKECQPSCERS